MSFSTGSLVKARNREWMVLPESNDNLLILRPLGGTENEVTGIIPSLEIVTSASISRPNAENIGDHISCSLLYDAVRLGFRSAACPLRSISKIAVDPRPYQLVPLLMALKLNPVRLLIADDVGIGKTVEAALIAKELLDRGEAKRLAVLCPPQLAEQWVSELKEKFHIQAQLVLPGTASRLERRCAIGQSLFDIYPHVVVSLDFIKADKRRDEFLRTCPELVIIDEAHTCSSPYGGKGSRHQRYNLLKGLASSQERHIILVTATPHSGKDDAFRSLLGLLNEQFLDLPEQLSGKENESHRKELAKHFIQRRRIDIRNFLDESTTFPERIEGEHTYKLHPEYKTLFNKVLSYARERVLDKNFNRLQQRVRWWSVLALLRCMASSPAAAAATLRARAAVIDAENEETVEEIGKHRVFDVVEDESAEGVDIVLGTLTETDTGGAEHKRLLEMARTADSLRGEKDAKLIDAAVLLKEILNKGAKPIVFCRFIETAEYLASELRKRLPSSIQIEAITGLLSPEDREERVKQLSLSENRLLVATDCLSEGINLQDYFDSVIHYDLSWNPTRHEQREGRVDRFGQKKEKVQVITYYGVDNQIDGIVIDVLINKHKRIRSSLGVSVPVPIDTNQVINAVFEGLLLREEQGKSMNEQLVLFEEYLRPQKEELFKQWDTAAEKEGRSRSLFAQESLKNNVAEVKQELTAIQRTIGSQSDVERFVTLVCKVHDGFVQGDTIDFTESPRALRDMLGDSYKKFHAGYSMPVKKGQIYLTRTHPVIEKLSSYLLDTAFDSLTEGKAKRAGVVRTARVAMRTTLLILRLRYHLITRSKQGDNEQLAEDVLITAFEGAPSDPVWLDSDRAEKLISYESTANVSKDIARSQVEKMISNIHLIEPYLNNLAVERGEILLQAHSRVRENAKIRGIQYRVEPVMPIDIIGIYIYLPV